jgi:hypothetical protein
MIIKSMDSKQKDIDELSSLLKEKLMPNQRFLIERELKRMRSGLRGEKDSAYYLNFYFGNSENWVVIHDLRIEHEGQVAQIDHLLLNRLFDFYVLESKNFSYGIKITREGEFQVYDGKQYFGIPSPIEQNKRHIHLLSHFLQFHKILPKRVGIPIKPNFKNFILVSPRSVITRPSKKEFNTSMVINADSLRAKIDKEVNKIKPVKDLSSISKFSSFSTIEDVAKTLASFHRPIKIDFRAKFGLSERASEN